MKNKLKRKLHNTIMESLLHLSDKRTKKCDTLGYFKKLAKEIRDRCEPSIEYNNFSELENIMVKEYVLSIAYFLHQERAS